MYFQNFPQLGLTTMNILRYCIKQIFMNDKMTHTMSHKAYMMVNGKS